MAIKRLQFFLSHPLTLGIFIYLILVIFFYPFYRYQLNPDGVAYITISRAYLHLDFSSAVNGYWGPLISWLLVPFLLLGIKSLVAFKIIQILIGMTTIIYADKLLKVLSIKASTNKVSIFIIALIITYYTYAYITPDLLFLCIGLSIISLLLQSQYLESKYSGFIIGVLGALLYLTKSYGFPYFFTTFTIVSLLFYLNWQENNLRRKIIRNYFIGMTLFLLISSCWIYLISSKYGFLTIGTAGKYNWDILSPYNSLGGPMGYMGLLDPSNKWAVSVWQDISIVKKPSWGLFDSWSTVLYQLKNIGINLLSVLKKLTEFSILSIPIILIALFRFIPIEGKERIDNNLVLIVCMTFLFLGYSFLIMPLRYIWLAFIITLIIGGKTLDVLLRTTIVNMRYKKLIVICFIVFFSYPTISKLVIHRYPERDTYQLSQRLENLDIHGKIASTGAWGKTLHVSFYNNWSYYGIPKLPYEPEALVELQNKEINYYFVWGEKAATIRYLVDKQEITHGSIEGLKIYKLR